MGFSGRAGPFISVQARHEKYRAGLDRANGPYLFLPGLVKLEPVLKCQHKDDQSSLSSSPPIPYLMLLELCCLY